MLMENINEKSQNEAKSNTYIYNNQEVNSPKRKIFFKILFETILQTAVRFTFPLTFVVGLVVLLFISINQKHADIDEKYWIFFGLGFIISITVTLFSENFNRKYTKLIFNLLAGVLIGIYILLLPEKLLPVHFYQVVVLGFAFTIGAFVVLFFRRNTDIQFWEFSNTTILQLIISFVFAQILMLGLSLAVLSLNELFKIDISEKVYANIAVICYGLFLPFYFLSNVPDESKIRKQEYKYDKFLEILGLYIVLPILAIYTAILYVYLIQIIAVWELPNGWVSWLVSVLALAGFLTLVIQYPLRLEKNKTVKFFARFFPIILLPLLVLMTVGISRRFGDYGLTINRAFVFILNFWLYGISIYLFISRSKHLKWIFISFACIAFLSVTGPWSVLNITKHTLKQEMISILNNNHYLINNTVVSQSLAEKIIISNEDNKTLNSNIEYLFENYGFEVFRPLFENDFEAKNKYSILDRLVIKNMLNESGRADQKYFYATLIESNFSFNIAAYSHFIKIDILNDKFTFKDSLYRIDFANGQLKISKINDQSPSILLNLKEKVDKLSRNESSDFTTSQMSVEGGNYKMLIVRIEAQIDPSNPPIRINSLEGFLFLK